MNFNHGMATETAEWYIERLGDVSNFNNQETNMKYTHDQITYTSTWISEQNATNRHTGWNSMFYDNSSTTQENITMPHYIVDLICHQL